MKFTLRWKQLMVGQWVACTLHVRAIDPEFIAEMVSHTDYSGISITSYVEE